MNKTYGEIRPPRTLMLRTHVGEAESAEGNKYTLSMSTSASPIIESKVTGKWFVLGWSDILELARAAGIDTP